LYYIAVLLLMLICPAASILGEHFFSRASVPLIPLIGKWFAFWAAGVRPSTAGLKQFFQPKFTATRIFAIPGDAPLPIVRELGVANFAMGIVGILSLLKPTFVLPVSITAALFYGIAGIRRITDKS